MEKIPEGFHGHHQSAEYDRNLCKILFTQAKLPAGESVSGSDITKKAVGRRPLLLVKVSKAEGKVTAIETPPPHVSWGDIPTPYFEGAFFISEKSVGTTIERLSRVSGEVWINFLANLGNNRLRLSSYIDRGHCSK